MNIFEKLAAEREQPLRILHGTDWWTDCDDIAALRLLCRAHKAGAVELKCICADAVMPETAASISAFIKNEGVSVPIGLDKSFNEKNNHGEFQKVLAEFPHDVENSHCEDGYRLYRRALSQLEGKAVITEIGFPQVIHQLLESKPDDISPLSGTELVKRKVEKILMMAGRWDIPNGNEHNLTHFSFAAKAANYIFDNCPVPITLLGFEAGDTVITGNTLKEDDMLKKAFNAHGSYNGRCSWDPMLVMLAIINDTEKAGYEAVHGKAEADAETGINNFTRGKGNHSYVIKKFDDSFYKNQINELLE